MKQASLKLNLNVKKTRKQVFLEQMAQVVPWAALVQLIAPVLPRRQDRMSAPASRGQALQGLKTRPIGARNGAALKDCA